MENDKIQNQIDTTAKDSQYTVAAIPAHTHNGTDSLLITAVDLIAGTPLKLGLGGMISASNNAGSGAVGEQIQTAIVSGKDQAGAGGNTTGNLQLNLLHQPQNTNKQSFINAWRPPVYGNLPGTTISTTLGGNTVTITGYGFTANALANALIDVYNSAGTLVETQIINSNTDTVITISGTWLNTTSNGTLFIFQPVFFGSSEIPWQRLYTREGTGAGIRFGVGPTAGGQNGLLYMDSAGNLYWRDKTGISTELNAPATFTSYLATGIGPAASSTQTINHGLGRVPVTIRISAMGGVIESSRANANYTSIGAYSTLSSNHCIYIRGQQVNPGDPALPPSRDDSNCINISNDDSPQNTGTALINNVTSTTFDLVWTVSASLVKVVYFWEAQ